MMKTFATAGAALLMTTAMATAGGIDRSGQFLGPIFEEGGESGTYFQFSFGLVNPEANNPALTNPLQDYSSLGFAYKRQLTDDLSATLIIDEPFGVAVEYVDPPFGVAPGSLSNGRAYIDSTAITGILRYELDNGFSVHGGIRAQEIGGVVVSTPGLLQANSGYDFGYLVGGAYERPDIALRVALTYNSSIENELSGTENFAPIADFIVETPESFNLEFQTGVAADTLVFGSIRYAMWDGFNLTANGNEYVNLDGDTTTYSVGVGRRLNDSLSVFATIGYEAAGDRPSSTALAPTTGTRSVGLGATYTMDNVSLTGGISYVELGDQGVGPGGVFEFNDNKAIGAGFRIGYDF
ncbi:MAG: hypothetical protein AAGL89_03610 [Pseudomonadota bacterium]